MTIYTFDPYWWAYWEYENNNWYSTFRFNQDSTFTKKYVSSELALYTCLENGKIVQLRNKYMIPVKNYTNPVEARIKKLYAKCKTTKHWG